MIKPSFPIFCTGLVVAYVLYSVYSIGQLFINPSCSSNERCITSYLSGVPRLQLYIFMSTQPRPSYSDVTKLDTVDNFDYNTPQERHLTLNIPWKTRQNGSLHLHLFLTPYTMLQQEWTDLMNSHTTARCRIPLTQLHVPDYSVFNLLNDKETKDKKEPKREEAAPVTHLKGKVRFNIMTENLTLPAMSLPAEIQRLVVVNPKGQYMPLMANNFLETRLEDLKLMKNSTGNLTLKYSPTSLGKLRLNHNLEQSLLSLRQMGFSAKDIDDMKNIFAGTNLYLLCLTLFIASFHLLFDILAFKNDVSFWRRKSNLEGLSARTVFWRAFSQTVILLYLIDERSSMLVLGPTFVGTVIEGWKVLKIIRRRGSTEKSEMENKTNEYDRESMTYLQFVLYPLCVGGAVYSLMYQPFKSWYSWCIHSLVNGVYAFGFVFMLPQLFINYKLKSVAALPWRSFMYKAFNTFIDDVFAFIITMPTAHRVACFRDDLVFLVYLYQRWLYPVDQNRIDEDARIIEPEVGQKIAQEKKDQ